MRGDLISCQIVRDLGQPKIIFLTHGDSGSIFIEISHLTDPKLQRETLKGGAVEEWPNQPPTEYDSGYYHFYMEDTDEDVENRFPTVMEELKKRQASGNEKS